MLRFKKKKTSQRYNFKSRSTKPITKEFAWQVTNEKGTYKFVGKHPRNSHLYLKVDRWLLIKRELSNLKRRNKEFPYGSYYYVDLILFYSSKKKWVPAAV